MHTNEMAPYHSIHSVEQGKTSEDELTIPVMLVCLALNTYVHQSIHYSTTNPLNIV